MPNLPDPMTREQYYLKAIAENIGNGGGGDIVIAEEQTCVMHSGECLITPVDDYNPQSYVGKVIEVSVQMPEYPLQTFYGECIDGELGEYVILDSEMGQINFEENQIRWMIENSPDDFEFVGSIIAPDRSPGALPDMPAGNGTYVLKMTVENGVGMMWWGNEVEA